MSFKDTLTDINTLYYNSTSEKELWGAVGELDKLLSGGQLNVENRENAEALYLKIAVKLKFYAYLKEFDGAVFCDLADYISTEQVKADERGYKKTAALMRAALNCARCVNRIVCKADEIRKELVDGVSAEFAENARISLNALFQEADGCDFSSPFGENVQFTDIKIRVKEYLESIISNAETVKKTDFKRQIKEYFKPVSVLYTLSEYFPLPDYSEGLSENATILCTPFSDEVMLYCAHNKRKDAELYTLDCAKLDGAAESFIVSLLNAAEQLNYDILIYGVESLSEGNAKKLFESAIRVGKSEVRVFIHDGRGDDWIYQSCLQVVAQSGLKASDVSRSYISMPNFSDVFKEFEDKGIITINERDLLKEMPFIGFFGLNKVITAFISGADWLKTGRKISKYNEPEALNYLSRLKKSYLLIDSGWGDYSSSDKNDEEQERFGEFDYDGVREIDRENVRRIVESEHSVFAKCGMIVRYCTLGGGDKTDWAKIEREEMSRRVQLATRLVFRILKVETVPEVEVLDELANSTAGGLCIDGGKRIEYKYSCSINWDWLVDAIVHESYHAMQSKLTNGGWSGWYLHNLHVTRGRVERWRTTRQIYNGDTHSKVYKVHVYENDANAFEIDCDDGRNFAWNTIELT